MVPQTIGKMVIKFLAFITILSFLLAYKISKLSCNDT